MGNGIHIGSAAEPTLMPPKSSVSWLMNPDRDPVPYSISNLVPFAYNIK